MTGMDETYYEQRHFNIILNRWSGWYPSGEQAFREHCAAPVRVFCVRSILADGSYGRPHALPSFANGLFRESVGPDMADPGYIPDSVHGEDVI